MDFQGPSTTLRTHARCVCFTSCVSLSPGDLLPGKQAVNKKRELFPGLPPTSPQFSRVTACPRPGQGILTLFPFALQNGISLSLRSGSLASKYCSRETFLHFGLQSSHLNICYCHQDLHYSPFQRGSPQRLPYEPHPLLLIGAVNLRQW